MIVGLAQVGALIPGVSRSGSTLTAALFLDLKREEAARFSFLLGLPAIALAGLKELWELHKAHLDLARLVGADARPDRRVALRLRRDLGPAADSRTLLGLALRGLSRLHRRRAARGLLCGRAELKDYWGAQNCPPPGAPRRASLPARGRDEHADCLFSWIARKSLGRAQAFANLRAQIVDRRQAAVFLVMPEGPAVAGGQPLRQRAGLVDRADEAR